MSLSRAEEKHIVALRNESPGLAVVNLKLAAMGGRMLPLKDGTPAPEPSQPRMNGSRAGVGEYRRYLCPVCDTITWAPIEVELIACRASGCVCEFDADAHVYEDGRPGV